MNRRFGDPAMGNGMGGTWSQWRAWGMAIRPRTLPLAVAPVLVGASVSLRQSLDVFDWWAFGACLGVATSLQVASNLANDLFDFRHGADRGDRVGPLRVMQAGLLGERQMMAALVGVLVLASLIGVGLVWKGGVVFAVLGGAAMIAAVAYTAGPFPLGYVGLGDVFVFVFFGMVAVWGTAVLTGGDGGVNAWAGGVAMGVLATNVLVVNNVRDVAADRVSGKKTLVVRFGRRQGRIQYGMSLLIAMGIPVVLAWRERAFLLALPVVMMPLGIRHWRSLSAYSPQVLNGLLGKTAMAAFLYAVLWGVGGFLERS